MFTICLTIMTIAATKSLTSHFFSILDKGANNYLNAFLAGLHSGLFNFKAKGKISRVFPEQWLSSCLAVNTQSGLLQWVLEARLIANVSLEAIRQNAPEHPDDLSGKLLLGGRKRRPDSWSVHSNKVTLLNIFSSAMSIEDMQEMTVEGEEKCSKQGDYLRWEDIYAMDPQRTSN